MQHADSSTKPEMERKSQQ